MRWCLLLLYLAITEPVAAQSAKSGKVDPARLENLEDAQKAAKIKADDLRRQNQQLTDDLTALKKDLIETAAEVESYEKAARHTQGRLSDIARQKNRLHDQIFKDREILASLLGALQQIQLTPPSTHFTDTNNTLERIQTRHLMAGVSLSLKERADTLAKTLQNLEDLQSQTLEEQKKLTTTETQLNSKQLRIKSLVEEKNDLKKSVSAQTLSERARARKLAKDAANLRDLISKFERLTKDIAPRVKPDRPRINIGRTDANTVRPRLKPQAGRPPEPLALPPDTKRFADARGRLRSPVTGRLKTSYGGKRKGITISTRAGAQVIAPYAGRVEFSGPFKNYDNVVILNVGGGYFILMTGLATIFTRTGETLESGEPVGHMSKTSSEKRELYIEFRKNGTPVNPKPWLGTTFAQAG